MKLSIAIIFCFFILGMDSERQYKFRKEAGQGAKDMQKVSSYLSEGNRKKENKNSLVRRRNNDPPPAPGRNNDPPPAPGLPAGNLISKVVSFVTENLGKVVGTIADNLRGSTRVPSGPDLNSCGCS